MSIETEIAIVGGGLNGCALALATAQVGFKTLVIDSLPIPTRQHDDFDGRAYALALGSKRFLKNIGVWDQVAKDAQPMLEIKVSDGRAGEGPSPWIMHFDHVEIEEGPMGFMVEDRHLRRALLSAMAENDKITHLAGETVVGQATNDKEALLTLQSGITASASCIVGSDGRKSGTAVRAGIKRHGWDYHQIALVCAVAHEKPHEGIAHQFFMPGGPLAILPLTQNRSAIVWSEEANRAWELLDAGDDGFLAALRPAFGDFLGDIKLCGKRFSYPLGMSLAENFTAERVVLVGDAAHGIHPIAGQGLNAGLRDIAALRDVLVEAKRAGEDVGNALVLARYQNWRQFDNVKLALATDGFNKLFSNDNPLLRTVRDIGMGAINSSPALRRGFVREAAGLSGKIPRLMQS